MSHRKHPALEAADPAWTTALVLVCSECDAGRGVDLAQDLKDCLKEAGHRKDVRVARVRCLGLCPKKGVAVAVTGPDRVTQSYVADARGEGAVEALCSLIVK